MKIFAGRVVSTKMAKTAKVAVESVVVNTLYKKRFKRVKNYLVHDEIGANVGQTVRFVASKPYSKLKKWKIVELVSTKDTKANKKTQKKEGSTKAPKRLKK